MSNNKSNDHEYILKCLPCSFATVVGNKCFPLICDKNSCGIPCLLYREDYLFCEENLGHHEPAAYGEWDKLNEDHVKKVLRGFFDICVK